MYKIKNKQYINKKLYISLEQTKNLLEKSRKIKTKPFYTELCKVDFSNNTLSHEPTNVLEDPVISNPDQEEEDDYDTIPLVEIYDNTESVPKELKNSFFDIQNNYFRYQGKDVFILVIENIVWFKAKDVANLLSFHKPEDAILYNVSKEDKVEFQSMNLQFSQTFFFMKETKIHPHTIFINIEGMYDLIMSSRKPEAKIFRRWLSHQVLPALNKFGSYSLGKKYGSFYDKEDLFEYQNQNVFYVAYIGVHHDEPLFKFGISFDYYRREFNEHKKIYQTFDLLYLRRSDNNRTVEELFKKECQIKELYRKIEIQGKQYTEIFTINQKNSFDRMRIILDKIIEQYPTKEILEREEKIKSLEHKIHLLQTMNDEKEKLTVVLQKDKTWLQRIIENSNSISDSSHPVLS
jgi:prophage antirepressor-like protein